MSTRSGSTASTYSHLLYLSDADRQCYLSGSNLIPTPSPTLRRESVSYFSMTSTRCSSESSRSEISLISMPPTPTSSMYMRKLSTPKYADDHYPLITSLQKPPHISAEHSSVRCAQEMAYIHNTLIRALNSVYNHAPSVVPMSQRCEDFLQFNQKLYIMLDQHHEMKQNFLFPSFERLLGRTGAIVNSFTSQNSFMDGFHQYGRYVRDPQTAVSFNCFQFRRLVESFAPSLVQHLHDEIPLLLSLYAVDTRKIRKIWTEATRLAGKDSNLYVDGPFILGCQDKTFLIDGQRGEFPGAPWVLETLVRRWYAKKHAGLWEFCPSDLQGNRKMLQL